MPERRLGGRPESWLDWLPVLALGATFAAAVLVGVGGAHASPKAESVSARVAAQALLDLNSATAAQLRALPGMGDNYVARVIAGRPYSAKNQLVQRGVLPEAEYERIKDFIIAHHLKK